MNPRPSSVSPFNLPQWAIRLARSRHTPFLLKESRMQLAIELASTNVANRTGGPFGAAVFERTTWRLIAVGVNLVEPTRCSHTHAEMVALANAQQAVGRFDLGAAGLPTHELVTSCEPCAMCYGAIPWAGIRSVLCGARASDAEAIGFDEGPKPKNWVAEFKKRRIAVLRDLCRKDAAAVLQEYKKRGGAIY